MTETIQTAIIIPFPFKRAGNQPGLGHLGRREVEVPVITSVSGSGWYHDAAIREAGHDRQR
ncbi:MAG: DUF2735 domain-containing protein [Hyphomicrobium aestuarii]|nr:DUF2735 domain-containing protein [Hyphomicrobium aestuarii]